MDAAPQPQQDILHITPHELAELIASAVARATHPTLRDLPPDALLAGPDAARYVYGRPDALKAWHKLRARHPEIDALSVGSGRLRRWRRADLDKWLTSRSANS